MSGMFSASWACRGVLSSARLCVCLALLHDPVSTCPFPHHTPQSTGIAILQQPGSRWKVVVLVLVCCSAVLAGGIAVGFASGKGKRNHAQGQAAAAGDSTQQQQQLVKLAQLPLPDSAAASQLRADPALPGTCVS